MSEPFENPLSYPNTDWKNTRTWPNFTNEVGQIRDDGQSFLSDLQGQSDQWRTFAEEQYELIISLIEGWDAPDPITGDSIAEPSEIALSAIGYPVAAPTPGPITSPGAFTAVSIDPVTISYDVPETTEVSEPDHLDDKSLSLEDISYEDFPDAPTFDEDFPDLDFTGEPGAAEIDDPGDAPVLTEANIPDAPTITMPDAPEDPSVTLPDDPVLNIPLFTAEAPEFVGQEPSGFEYHEDTYTSTLNQALVDKLIADIEASSSGIDPDVEQALYDRGLTKLHLEHDQMQSEAEGYFASKGFFMPPGALSSKLTEMASIRSRAVTDLNNDIIVQRSNLVQQNIQTIMGAGVQLEGMLKEFHSNVQNRSLEKSKAIADHGIQLYNAHVERLKTDAQIYVAEAQVYSAKLQGEIAKVEKFRALVEKAKVSAEVQEMLVRIYVAKLEGVKAQVEIYKTEMESAKIFTEVQVAKIEAFKAKVDAFIARWQGEDTKWKAYGTKIQAQGIKASAFSERVKVFQAETEAWGTNVNALVSQSRLMVEDNNSKVAAYQSEIQRYQEEAKFELSRIQYLLGRGELQIRGVTTESQHAAAKADIAVRSEMGKLERSKVLAENDRAYENLKVQAEIEHDKMKLGGEVAEHQAEAQVKSAHLQGVVAARVENAKNKLYSKVEEFKLHMEQMKAQAAVMSQIAASALSAMNANLSYGFSGGYTGNVQVGGSYSTSEQFSESVGFNVSNQWSDSRAYNRNRNINTAESLDTSHNYYYSG